jgi:uncharacterized protein YuzB (UPF0349 family)
MVIEYSEMCLTAAPPAVLMKLPVGGPLLGALVLRFGTEADVFDVCVGLHENPLKLVSGSDEALLYRELTECGRCAESIAGLASGNCETGRSPDPLQRVSGHRAAPRAAPKL